MIKMNGIIQCSLSMIFIRKFGFLLFIFSINIFSQATKETPKIKKIYLEAIYESNGVSIDHKNKVRNQISLNLYKYFKKTHSFIDDVIINGYLNQLKKQQQIGCSTDKCYRMIEDSLNPDEKISGSISNLNGKYTLTLRLIDLSKSRGLIDVKEISYSLNQMEYFIEEITRSLLEPGYSINFKDAPPEFIEEKLDFANMRIKSQEGVDINLYEFRTKDTKSDLIIASLRSKLEEGDRLFKQKDYSGAGDTYQSILDVVQESLIPETKKQISAILFKGAVANTNWQITFIHCKKKTYSNARTKIVN